MLDFHPPHMRSSPYRVQSSGVQPLSLLPVFASSQSGKSCERASGWPAGPSSLPCCCCRPPSTVELSAKRPRSPQPLRAELPTGPRLRTTQTSGGWTPSGGAWSPLAATLTRCWSWWAGVMECANTAAATVEISLLWALQCPKWCQVFWKMKDFYSWPQRRTLWILSHICYHVGDGLTQSSQSTFRVPAPLQHHPGTKRALWVSNLGVVWSPGGVEAAALWEYLMFCCAIHRKTSCSSPWLPGARAWWMQLLLLWSACSRRGTIKHKLKKIKSSGFFSLNHCWRWLLMGQMDMGIPAMTKCCNQLDMCYDTCGSNKYRCDSKFRWCLHSICSDLKKSLGFVSKVEGRFSVNLFILNTSQKQTISYPTGKSVYWLV